MNASVSIDNEMSQMTIVNTIVGKGPTLEDEQDKS